MSVPTFTAAPAVEDVHSISSLSHDSKIRKNPAFELPALIAGYTETGRLSTTMLTAGLRFPNYCFFMAESSFHRSWFCARHGLGFRHDSATSVKTGEAAAVENSQSPGTELPPPPG